MVPPEFHPAQHIGPQFVLDRGREFPGIMPGIVAIERVYTYTGANLRGIHNFTAEVKGQLVRGLNGGIKAGHPDAVVVAICSTAVIEVEVVEGGPQLHSGTGRRQGQPRIIAASGASTVTR